MPRVPVQTQPSVRSRPLSTPYQRVEGGTGGSEFARGLYHAADVIGNVDTAYRKERARARQLRKTEELTRYVSDINSTLYGPAGAADSGQYVPGGWGVDVSEGASNYEAPHGFLRLKGKEPGLYSDSALKHLQKRQQEIAANLEDEELRAEFLAETSKLYESTRVQVLRHAGAQFDEAEVVAQKGLVDQGLTAVTKAFRDDDAVEAQLQVMEQQLRKGSLSDEEAAAKALELRSRVAQIRMDNFLAEDNIAGAAAVFKGAEGDIGPELAAKYRRVFTLAEKGMKAEALAGKIVENARQENGDVDDDRAIAELEWVDGGLRDEVDRELKTRLVKERQAWAAGTDRVSKQAYAAYNTGGWNSIHPKLKDELNQRNPALYNQLRDDAERRWKRSQGGAGGDRRAGSRANKLAMLDYMRRPAEERAQLDLDVTYGASGVDEIGIGELRVKQREAKESVEKGQASNEGDFVRDAKAAAQDIYKDKKTMGAFEAHMRTEFTRFQAEKKRPPSRKEAQTLIDEALIEGELRKGWWRNDPDVRKWQVQPGDVFYTEDEEEPEEEGDKVAPGGLNDLAAGRLDTPPAAPPARMSKRDRALQLKGQGKSNAEIARILTDEGY